jgi:hypothetical protein
MTVLYTLPADDRVTFGAAPAADMNSSLRALKAMGAGLNILAAGAGIDPAGTTASDVAINAFIDAAPAGPVYIPPGRYLLYNPINLYGSNPAAPVPHKLIGMSLEGESGVMLIASASFGARPVINASTKYAPAGVPTQFSSGELQNLYINVNAAPSAVGIYYDRVQQIRETNVKIRGGACGRVIGWANDVVFDSPRSWNQSDCYWKGFSSYTADAPWDTAEAGHTIGPGGTYSQPNNLMIIDPFNYLTAGFGSGTANAYFMFKAPADIAIKGGHSLRVPGAAGHISNGLVCDYSGFAGGPLGVFLLCDFHEIDGAYDGAGNGAGVVLNNVLTAVFGDNFWCSAAPAADGAGMWALQLTNCSDIQIDGYWNGKGVLLDGVSTRLNVKQARFPQGYGGGVFQAKTAGTLNAAMNTLILPQGTVVVDNIPTANLPQAGQLSVATAVQPAIVSYTGWSGTNPVTFTGCTLGSGTLATGGAVELVSFTSSRFAPRYYAGILGSPNMLASIAQASPAQYQGPSLFLGNAATAPIQIGRADGKSWQIMMDNSATGTLIFKNSAGSTRMQMSDAGALTVVADLDITLAGRGLRIAEGSNAKQGRSTLAGGTVTVANTSVTANSGIVPTAQDNNTTGALRISARVVGTSFTITSSNPADSGVVFWEIFEPG